MSKWVNRLNLKDLWEAHDKGNITIKGLGERIAKRIKKLASRRKRNKIKGNGDNR